MKEHLAKAYVSRLLLLFSETKKHMSRPEFGAEKAIIATTIPIMILENWREESTSNNIPLLDEVAKNVILACAAVLLGWEKTAYLHLRVVLENALNGMNLFHDTRKYNRFMKDGIIHYTKISEVIDTFTHHNRVSKQLNSVFKLKQQIQDLYKKLSSWSHSLGSEYFSDLKVLGRKNLSYAKIKSLKENFKITCRITVIIYLYCKPEILNMVSSANQRLLLSNFSIKERGQIRHILNA